MIRILGYCLDYGALTGIFQTVGPPTATWPTDRRSSSSSSSSKKPDPRPEMGFRALKGFQSLGSSTQSFTEFRSSDLR